MDVISLIRAAKNPFPPHTDADKDGVIAAGGPLSPELLLLAYCNGIFPWPPKKDLLLWYSPPERSILFFDSIHFSTSFKKFLKKTTFEFRVNTAFEEVMRACAKQKRAGQRGTWIFPEMIRGYTELHRLGFAHSFECFQDNNLVGGVYGIKINRYFSAESMFHTVDNSSKFALYHGIELLKKEKCTFIDSQVINPFTESLGAIEITRDDFLKLLTQVL